MEYSASPGSLNVIIDGLNYKARLHSVYVHDI